MTYNKKIISIVITGFVLRLIYSIYVVGNGVNYFEYGIIVDHILAGNGFSYTFEYLPPGSFVKSAYMPPGYVFFLFPFFLIKSEIIRGILFFLVQNLIASATIYLLYRYVLRFFSENIALISAVLVALLPDFIFIANSVTPTVLFHFLLIILLFVLEKGASEPGLINGLKIGGLLALIGYIRGEFLLFAAMVLLYFFIKKNFRLAFISASVVFLLLSPWIVRNYITFERFVPVSTNFGLNFYRGHNIYQIGDWGDEKILSEIEKVKRDPDFEIKMSDIFLNRSLEMIRENPAFEIMNSIKKLLHLWVMSPIGFQNSYIISLILWLLLLPFGIFGLIKSYSFQKFKFIYLLIFYFCINAILFFVLIRYQIMFKLLLIPFIAYGITGLFVSVKKMLLVK